MKCQKSPCERGAQGEIRRVKSHRVIVGGVEGAGPPQPHGPSERSRGRKTRAKWKRGKKGAKLRREGEGKHLGEKERSNGARNCG